MSAVTAGGTIGDATERRWGLWARQVLMVAWLEIRKSFWGRRALIVYLLALAPVGLMSLAVLSMVLGSAEIPSLTDMDEAYGAMFQIFVLRWCVFFGCVAVFMNLFRGEVLDGSLHYYFLAAVRREIVVVGKYLAGLLTAVYLFSLSAAMSMLLIYTPHGPDAIVDHLLNGPVLGYMATYLGIVALACLGYGALFLVIGLIYRNPILPALIVLGWESINFLLPPFLKKLSVVHYLHSLLPIPLSEGPFALVAEPAPAWQAVVGLAGLTAVLLALAAWRVRHMEIRYSDE